MLKRILNLLLLIVLMGAVSPVFAQRAATDVNVDQLTDEQVQKIMNEVNSRGLTMDQAIQMAKARGASQQQIDQLTQRIQEMQSSGKLNKSGQGTTSSQNQKNSGQKGNFYWNADQDSSLYSSKADSLQVKKDAVSEKNKKIFGYQLFNKKNLTFEPSVNIPVPDDYVLGIGDEITVNVWGASQQTYTLDVDNNGDINFPDLGPVKVAGINYNEARKLIKDRLTTIYSGMAGGTPNTFADVTLGNPRAIKVNVIGEAIAPGTYTLPATASAFNALYLSGGPDENGSFRSIHVIRDNKLFAKIDVYDYLINGNTASNVSLRDQDIIYIPTYEKRVETAGSFKRDNIFELKQGENIQQLLKYSGGFSENASSSRLLITRFDNGQYQLVDIDKDQFDTAGLQNGDLIRAEKVIDRFENRVSIEGAVFRPGPYALEKDMTLSRLIAKAGGLREDHFAPRGLIIRLDNQLYPTTIAFNVDDVMKGANDPLLKREDKVIIRDIFSIGEKETVEILGEVMTPGEYDYQRNMTLKDLVFLAGGMTEAASESYLEVARRNSHEEASVVNSKLASLYQFKVDRDLNLTPEDAGFILQPFDQVYIRRAPSYEKQKTVKIEGEVQYPGEYSISDKNERISDLIRRAGGLTPYAFAEGAKMKRFNDDQIQIQMEAIKRMKMKLDTTQKDTMSLSNQEDKDRFTQLELRLSNILQHPGTSYDYYLKDKDQIIVPMKSEEIWVTGEVLTPIGLSYEHGRGIKYYVSHSGGFSSNAKKSKVYVVYSNGTTQITRSFIWKDYPEIKPGCRIVVPEKPQKNKTDSTSKWLAFTTALSSLAIALAAVF